MNISPIGNFKYAYTFKAENQDSKQADNISPEQDKDSSVKIDDLDNKVEKKERTFNKKELIGIVAASALSAAPRR